MTKEEAINWMKEFIKEVDSQDNRGTSQPIQFLLQTKMEYVAHPEYNWRAERVWRHPEMEGASYKEYEDAVKWLVEYGYEGEKLEKEKDNIEEFQMGHYWETNQMFFTEKGVKRHLNLNRHNLKEHRDYVVHAFRNPEMRELFEAIREVIK
jgi:hypothetical protein